MTDTFSYRPALLRNATDWTLQGRHLSGPGVDLNLADVKSGRFVETSIRAMRMRRLDLHHNKGHVRLSLNCPVTTGPDEADRATHRALLRAVAEALPPDCPITLGESGPYRWILFAIGVCAALFGFVVMISVFAGATNARGTADVVTGTAILALFGVYIAMFNIPWKPLPAVPAQALGPMILRMDNKAPPQDQTSDAGQVSRE